MDEGVAGQIADVMFALSTPSRVQILGCLMGGQRSVGELVEELGFEQSGHPHQLREHGLVRAERLGRRRVYAPADDDVAALLAHAIRRVTSRASPAGRLRGAASQP
ncbi:helix-turn-helix transcriptional regulator [Frankia sp. AgB1.9]|uniref:ArsR/SmtB family transcription factor n=1 Tax=unclassified Frankia TaxID=2632575 RepID=UPI001931D5BB|nr:MULTISPECIES: metalloregulator ArsR/SmtB family transcription factor [unclassified Frankia]MBL7489921.1 helix-turn-helix transcriptional regulator [Frankia sp. AgW1.1]MBL7552652.1 helix-turn-helix transcriptional regulator [Frankia sp. AgB1.9]MBL7623816.1 helix-turn-helix transcriptional regulator [Frankia sp. AgB1.8]